MTSSSRLCPIFISWILPPPQERRAPASWLLGLAYLPMVVEDDLIFMTCPHLYFLDPSPAAGEGEGHLLPLRFSQVRRRLAT